MARLHTVHLAAWTLLLTLSNGARAADEEGFVPLFNGKDLSGWVNVNVAPATFTVRDGIIVSTGVPTGVIRTEKQYENFVVELEWKHIVPGGNAGCFVWSDAITAVGQPFTRSFECQILDGQETANYTSQGDVFAIHGSFFKPDRPHPGGWMRSLPSEKRTKPAGEWNHYRIECNNGVLKLAVNGKVVSGGSESKPRKGYICLEAEGSECHFRNIRVKELPSTNPKPDEIAAVDVGFKAIYTGLDLSGWVQEPGHKGHWRAKDWNIDYDGKSEAADKNLWTEKEYGDFQMIVDWKLPQTNARAKRPILLPTGEAAKDENGKPKEQEVADAGDSGVYLRGSTKAQVNIWCWPVGSGEVSGYRTDATLPASVRAAATPKTRADKRPGQWNRFIITMKGSRLTVDLNGQTVIDAADLPGMPARGRIGLEHGGSPIQFGNIYVRELEPGQ